MGNDEYNLDDGWDKNDYITCAYGPLGKAREQGDQDSKLLRAGINPKTGRPL